MLSPRTVFAFAFAVGFGAVAHASVVMRTGSFGPDTNYYDAFTYNLGPGSYTFTLTFSTPVQDVQNDTTVEKVTTTNYYCDFGDGQGEVYCGGDDVPSLPIFDQVSPTRYQTDLTVNPPYDEPPPSPPPYMRYDEFDTCCFVTLDFDTLDAGTYTLSYTAVPEPRTWSLLIMGLFGVGALARMRLRASV